MHEPVIGYRMVVDGLDAGGSSFFVTHIWRLLFDASEVENFIVEDRSGSIRVDASDALLLLDYQNLDEGRIYDGLAGGLIDFWERYGLSSTTVATVRKLRLLECLLKPDTGVFVFGVASAGDRTVPGTGTYRDAPRPELSIGPFPSRGVVISDRRRADLRSTTSSRRRASCCSPAPPTTRCSSRSHPPDLPALWTAPAGSARHRARRARCHC